MIYEINILERPPLFFLDSLMERDKYRYYVEQGLVLLNIIFTGIYSSRFHYILFVSSSPGSKTCGSRHCAAPLRGVSGRRGTESLGGGLGWGPRSCARLKVYARPGPR